METSTPEPATTVSSTDRIESSTTSSESQSTPTSSEAKVDPVTSLSGKDLDDLLASILVAIPYRGSEGIDANLENKISYWRGCGIYVEKVEDQFGGFIELTRASICKKFLDACDSRPALDKIVMIDSDQDVAPEAPVKLAQWDLPVVSGVVSSPNSRRGIFANFTVKDKYGVPRFPSVRHTKKLPSRGLLKVHSTGTGLICIKKNVIESIFNGGDIPFYIEEKMRRSAVTTGVLKLGEDTRFSEQCKKLGFDIYVDFSTHAVHYKRVGITWPTTALDQDLRAEDFQVDVRDYLHG
jgi:hypothetical protein